MPCVIAVLVLCPGVDEPDSGVVRNRGIKIGYLPQMPDLEESLSAIDAVMQSESLLARCLRNYDEAMRSDNKKACSLLSDQFHAHSCTKEKLITSCPHVPIFEVHTLATGRLCRHLTRHVAETAYHGRHTGFGVSSLPDASAVGAGTKPLAKHQLHRWSVTGD